MKKTNFLVLFIGAMLLLVEAAFGAFGIQTSIQMPPGQSLQVNGVEVENWTTNIIENLFKDNEFMQYAYDEGEYVLNGKVVHIPQAGSKPNVVKNRVGAGTIVERADSDVTYALDGYTSDPILITNIDAIQVSYDKITNVLTDMQETLNETVADNMLYNWSKDGFLAAAVIKTTGSNNTTADQIAPGATGTRKLFVKENLLKAQAVMNKQKISKKDRYALLPTEFITILNSDTDLIKRDSTFGGELEMREGRVSKLYGFTILERSDVLITDGSFDVKAPDAVAATDDNLAAFCWQRNCVTRAIGEKDFFYQEKVPTHYGNVYSMLLRMGGRARRADKKGIVLITQQP